MDILGVEVDNFPRKGILQKVGFFLSEEKPHRIATVNPEFILQAQKDTGFRDILNSSDLRVADGAGILFAFLRAGKLLKARVTGVELMQEILRLAEKNDLAVFLVSYKGALSGWEETRAAILKIYPDMKIDGIDLGDKQQEYQVVGEYPIVLCSLGAPYQERFINRLKNDKIRLAIGVGGSFDFLTGKRKRAPKFLQRMGLEWCWRFLQEPRYRARRIWNAVIIFPITVLIKK